MAVEFLGGAFWHMRWSRHLVGLLFIALYIYIPPLTRQLFYPALFPFLLPECLIQNFNVDIKSRDVGEVLLLPLIAYYTDRCHIA